MRALADPKRAEIHRWYLKAEPGGYGEGDEFLGLTVPKVRSVAKKAGGLTREEVLELLDSPLHEERMLALFAMVDRYAKAKSHPAARQQLHDDFLERRHRANNWDLIDGAAPTLVGEHLADGLGDAKLLDRLAVSASLWDRRVAMVSTLAFIRRGKVDPTGRIAKKLLADGHDLIHKAVGWMLREAGKRDESFLVAFLTAHYDRLPRTTLRYAIEKFDQPRRKRWLAGVDR